ncbi:MAG: Ribosomal RNA small subunit methyltransferase A [Nitrospirae bacterium]|nr:Ribosomal RNA small subunit methyltransferase A [Nitrospirota bacterium]MCK6497886.1 16S rRNA (adenine(1518)-N(6)/adenine(1519)-N(6))-dimethyltransferase RsmA [Nitrospira sp.]MEB2337925.1 16S rRNA (adenine(1518)-N(6)/adenine(1519)-N(6))-dimethyltransferase RsmA [Nitrospirales bacterium]QOJ35010.1 MAG: ribosomal RNA small subunit methyltransferase A [Nitrospira sp.]
MARPFPPALKRLGQNFLIDPNIVRKIIALAALRPGETVLEIGPGRGALTEGLCMGAARVIAVEIDPQLEPHLREQIGHRPNLDLRIGDALQFPFESLPAGTVVVANLPYYVSTPLLFAFLDARASFSRMVLMLQTEVARRLAARPNQGDYGVLSVLTQDVATVDLAFTVSANCFRPRPTVGSAVVRLVLHTHETIDPIRQGRFRRLVRASFAHRRKTVINSLRDEGFPFDRLMSAMESAGVSPQARAEMLALEDYRALAQVLDADLV